MAFLGPLLKVLQGYSLGGLIHWPSEVFFQAHVLLVEFLPAVGFILQGQQEGISAGALSL